MNQRCKIFNIKDYSLIIFLGICLFYLLNILTIALVVIPDVLYYRALLVLELVLVFLAFVQFNWKFKINKNSINRLAIILIVQLFAYVVTNITEKYECFDIHRLFIFLLMYFVFFECAKNINITFRNHFIIHKMIFFIGLFACIYNLLVHQETILTFNLGTIMFYTSTYSSFFLTRSNYCLLLVVSYIISLYFYEISKNKRWICAAIFFVGNILLTNARTSIITVVTVTVFFLFFQKNKILRNLFLIFIGIIIFLLMPWDILIGDLNDFIQKYYLLFFRNNIEDLSNGRLGLWISLFQDLNPVNIFIGHGIGSKDAYLTEIGAIATSFHNLWLDIFYEGGIILLGLFFYTIYYVVKKVKNSHLSDATKQLFYCYIVILIVSGMGDAIATPFMLDTSSIFSTIIFITLPICVTHKNNFLLRKE